MSQDIRLDEELATQRRARILAMNYVDTSRLKDKTLYHEILTVAELIQLKAVPLEVTKGNLLFGVTTTTSQQNINLLRQRFADYKTTFAIVSDTGYRDYLRLYDPPKQVVYQDIAINQSDNHQLIDQISSILSQVRADDMLAYLVQQAHRLNASDIHLETQVSDVRIRFRIDGVLHAVAQLDLDKYRILIAAIASAGSISTSADEAQQGHISQKVKMADGSYVDVNVRLETVPTINGMDVVMRLFNMDQSMYTLDRLGLSTIERQVVDDIIAKPSGLVLIVGPTGSGKTTTLYSMLNSLNIEERKIITIEDPVEYQFAGVTQISVSSKVNTKDISFANKLRAVLRLDPDVVMVGEIRDMDTAKTALQASLTGHLVLSTFHAGSAAAAITRLDDIIRDNPLFISAIRLVMSQRLIRQLDDSTKQAYDPTEFEWHKINDIVASFPEGLERPNLEGLKLFKPGISSESPYGFKGQIAIREQFTMSGAIRQILEKSGGIITTQLIEQAAGQSGMRTMLQDGILKVIDGRTTLEEILRVVG